MYTETTEVPDWIRKPLKLGLFEGYRIERWLADFDAYGELTAVYPFTPDEGEGSVIAWVDVICSEGEYEDSVDFVDETGRPTFIVPDEDPIPVPLAVAILNGWLQ